jgi:trafficking protein particle complex subunit 13
LIPPTASLSYPSSTTSDQRFALSQNLSLPPSFGSAYVGETFSCGLCANNEVTESASRTKSVSNIKILAEMQTPTSSVPLNLATAPDNSSAETSGAESTSTQYIISFALREEGTHVLAVNVTYTETTFTPSATDPSSSSPTSSRTRSFRKLYQFPSVPCLSVRTKSTELPPVSIPDKAAGPYGRTNLLRYTLEAQLENVSDNTITLESALLHAKAPFESIALNWNFGQLQPDPDADPDPATPTTSSTRGPILPPRDIHQLSYLLTQNSETAEGLEELRAMLKRDGRAVLGQLSIAWRGSMGEKGSLTTGGLLSRRRVG